MIRKVAIALAMTLALVAPSTMAAAATAPGTGSHATADSASVQGRWVIEGYYPTLFDCENVGAGGVLYGRWQAYDCEYDPFSDSYRLWVETLDNPRLCQADAHAYVVRNGSVYFSGYEGSESLGVPTLYVSYGTKVTLGGNGINPNSSVSFKFIDVNTGAQVGSGSSRNAGNNCVANENSYTIYFSAGTYVAKATYKSGNSQNTYTDHRETFIVVY